VGGCGVTWATCARFLPIVKWLWGGATRGQGFPGRAVPRQKTPFDSWNLALGPARSPQLTVFYYCYHESAAIEAARRRKSGKTGAHQASPADRIRPPPDAPKLPPWQVNSQNKPLVHSVTRLHGRSGPPVPAVWCRDPHHPSSSQDSHSPAAAEGGDVRAVLLNRLCTRRLPSPWDRPRMRRRWRIPTTGSVGPAGRGAGMVEGAAGDGRRAVNRTADRREVSRRWGRGRGPGEPAELHRHFFRLLVCPQSAAETDCGKPAAAAHLALSGCSTSTSSRAGPQLGLGRAGAIRRFGAFSRSIDVRSGARMKSLEVGLLGRRRRLLRNIEGFGGISDEMVPVLDLGRTAAATAALAAFSIAS